MFIPNVDSSYRNVNPSIAYLLHPQRNLKMKKEIKYKSVNLLLAIKFFLYVFSNINKFKKESLEIFDMKLTITEK